MDINLNKTINIIVFLSLFDDYNDKNIYFCMKNAIDDLVSDSSPENYMIFDHELTNPVILINNYSDIENVITAYYNFNFIDKGSLCDVVERLKLLSPILKKSNTSFNCIDIDGNQVEVHFINSNFMLAFIRLILPNKLLE